MSISIFFSSLGQDLRPQGQEPGGDQPRVPRRAVVAGNKSPAICSTRNCAYGLSALKAART